VGTFTTIEQLDAGISELRAALAEVEEALVALDGDPTRALLAATALSGETNERWQRADQELRLLWNWFLAVTDLLADVTQRRGSKSSLPPAQLQSLAAECSRPAAEILGDTPLPGALRASGRPVTLSVLLAAMRRSAQEIERVVRDTETAWDRLVPRLAEVEASATAVERAAQSGGVRAPNDLTVARRLIGELRRQCTSDPLSVRGDPVVAIAQGVQRAQAGVQEALRARDELDGQIAASLAEVQGAVEQLERARGRQRESAQKVSGGEDVLAGIDGAAGELQAQLKTLRDAAAAAAAGDHDGAARSLAAARQRYAAALERARSLTANAGRDLATRDELRGRLDAYRAKARAIGRGEDLQLEDLYQQAIGELYSAPCDLSRCSTLVVAYQRALAPGSARNGR
jgi:hypothetical protein